MAQNTTEEALVYELLNAAGVSAIVGTRVYHHQAPQSTAKPFIVYRLEETEHPPILGGSSGWRGEVFTVAGVAASADTAIALGNAIVTALHAQRGAFGGPSPDEITALGVFALGVGDVTETRDDGGEIQDYIRPVSVRIARAATA